jgi:hypothetical protein
MRQLCLALAGIVMAASAASAQTGPYKVLKTAKTGRGGGRGQMLPDSFTIVMVGK